MNWLKTILFTILYPGSVTVLVPYLILSGQPREGRSDLDVVRVSGLLLIAVGIAGFAWCAREFVIAGRGTPAPYDPPKALVVSGLFRYTRNPMYVSVVLVVLGEAVLFASPWLFGYAAALWVAFHLRVRYYEEPTLRRSFGATYEEYCRAVPRWVPRSPHD
jgi:protein-S-isoprenylcysteine O-methyltransferase Ste14